MKKVVPHNSKSDLPLAILLEHMPKKFEINQTKIKGGCQSGRKVVTHSSKNDLPLVWYLNMHITFVLIAVYYDTQNTNLQNGMSVNREILFKVCEG